jgi:hypothetical protein
VITACASAPSEAPSKDVSQQLPALITRAELDQVKKPKASNKGDAVVLTCAEEGADIVWSWSVRSLLSLSLFFFFLLFTFVRALL